jgi:hypothetical protein
MTQRNPGRLAIHRRSDEIAFLQHRLRVLSDAHGLPDVGGPQEDAFGAAADQRGDQPGFSSDERYLRLEVLVRERDLADELLHTRQIDPLGEALQRRLAMAERVCRDLAPRSEPVTQSPASISNQVQDGEPDSPDHQDRPSEAYWVAEIERRALAEMLNLWWAWLRAA